MVLNLDWIWPQIVHEGNVQREDPLMGKIEIVKYENGADEQKK
jgi:hypothetical protein